MRVWGAKNFGSGQLLSAYSDDGTEVYVLVSGAVVRRTESESVTVCYGDAYCRTADGSVTLKGGVPVYG